ncbi:hypothetical protein ACX51_12630 [Lacticaseibacillus paracasei]|uniref:Cation transporter n=1 Tax=Lacticaseibacillus paracasei TaxID=1597 RepID=A0ABD6VY34_LACPA|nr:cation diffusion facilitator family transporter [Lacticaseibacillus paracasei]POE40593.1 hypothetical protein ACX51_12630 [Lacticaseibacillus paracasei]
MDEPHEEEHSFSLGMFVNGVYAALEMIAGFILGSIALTTDALHNVSDIVSLGISYVAEKLFKRKPTARRTYGMRGASIIAAVLNGVIIITAMSVVILEAVRKLNSTVPISSTEVMVIAGFGILVNGGTALLFVKNRKNDLNVKGAFLHMLGDTGVSLAVVISGLVIQMTGWSWVDPVIAILMALFVIVEAISLLKDAVNMELEAVPTNVDTRAVEQEILDFDSVVSLHDLHIWSLSTKDVALTVHLRRDTRSDNDLFICQLEKKLHADFGIDHMTIQIECGNYSELEKTDNTF